MTNKQLEKIEIGTKNVFADLGLPNPEEVLRKAKLSRAIGHAIQEKGLSQKKAAELLGIDQPKISRILRGHFTGFSTDRLIRFLNILDREVEIIVKKRGQHKKSRLSNEYTRAYP